MTWRLTVGERSWLYDTQDMVNGEKTKLPIMKRAKFAGRILMVRLGLRRATIEPYCVGGDFASLVLTR